MPDPPVVRVRGRRRGRRLDLDDRRPFSPRCRRERQLAARHVGAIPTVHRCFRIRDGSDYQGEESWEEESRGEDGSEEEGEGGGGGGRAQGGGRYPGEEQRVTMDGRLEQNSRLCCGAAYFGV